MRAWEGNDRRRPGSVLLDRAPETSASASAEPRRVELRVEIPEETNIIRYDVPPGRNSHLVACLHRISDPSFEHSERLLEGMGNGDIYGGRELVARAKLALDALERRSIRETGGRFIHEQDDPRMFI